MKLFSVLVIIVLVLVLVGCSIPNSPDAKDTSDTYSVYLAPLFVSRPLRGTEVWEGSASSTIMLPIWDELKPDFIKMPIYWSHVEKYQDIYVWPTRYDLD